MKNIFNWILKNLFGLLVLISAWLALLISYLNRRTELKKQRKDITKIFDIVRDLTDQLASRPSKGFILDALSKVGVLKKDELKQLKQITQIITADVDERYRKIVINQNRIINLLGIRFPTVVDVKIKEVFIPLRFKTVAHSRIDSRPLSFQDSFITKQLETDLETKEIFKLMDCIMILGGPGSGKSTFLQHLALLLAQRDVTSPFGKGKSYLPILVKLRKLTSDDYSSSPLDVLTRLSLISEWGVSKSFFEEALSNNQCVVMLDGLDEVIMKIKKEIVIDWIERFSKAFLGNYFIITSRMASYVGDPLPTFKKIQVAEFRENDIREFCKKWFNFIELSLVDDKKVYDYERAKELATDKSLGLVKQIYPKLDKKSPDYPKVAVRFQELAKTPLLLTLMAIVYGSKGSLPNEKVKLYRDCVDILLESWDAAKDLQLPFRASQSLPMLQELALWLTEQGIQSIKYDNLLIKINELLPKIGYFESIERTSKAFIDFVRDRSGLIVGFSDNTFGFQHLTFQEYLAACELCEKKQINKIISKISDPIWSEVLDLYAGIADLSDFIKNIVEQETVDSIYKNFFILHQMLKQARKIEPSLKKNYFEILLDKASILTGREKLFDYHINYAIIQSNYENGNLEIILNDFGKFAIPSKCAVVEVFTKYLDQSLIKQLINYLQPVDLSIDTIYSQEQQWPLKLSKLIILYYFSLISFKEACNILISISKNLKNNYLILLSSDVINILDARTSVEEKSISLPEFVNNLNELRSEVSALTKEKPESPLIDKKETKKEEEEYKKRKSRKLLEILHKIEFHLEKYC